MDPRRLRLLLELSRRGSMRAVADELGYTTSTVSQQLAVLAREAGTPLIEPAGRMVRLTPAGQRLADDEVDLALVYDYNLAPRAFGRDVSATPLWTAHWHVAVPAEDDPVGTDASPAVLRRYADAQWIVNSRDTADETALLAIAALAG